MKNTFGNNISVTLFGESHGAYIGAVLDGMPAGIEVDVKKINDELALRRPKDQLSTSRKEADEFIIASGVFNSKTTGTPITILIPNTDTRSKDYNYGKARPSHADYTAFKKYGGFEDFRGGGHFSGRLTAPLCAVGAIARSALESKGILLETHIKSIADITDRDFENYATDFDKLRFDDFAVLDGDAADKMKAVISAAKSDGDSVGGVLESVVTGMPAGVGEPWFDSMESMISHALFSIPGVKGVEFGAGFDITKMYGSTANDPFYIENGKVYTKTNNNGGINGGITNGMPIIVRTAIKPTPSIAKPQQTVDFITGENVELEISGRHDPCIVHRARAVVNSILALTVCDMLATSYGREYLK